MFDEGRRAFLKQVAGIEAGGECDRLVPLLSALADGEAAAQDLALVRLHLRTCLVCRKRLRELREAPARVAALVPAAAVAGSDGGGALRGALESLIGSLGERAHTAAELVSSQKVAAVAASAAVLAGGGAGLGGLAGHPDPPHTRPVVHVRAKPVKEERAVAPLPAAPPAPAPVPEPAPAPPATEPATGAAQAPPPPPPDPAAEFTPAPGPEPAAAAAPAPAGGGGSGEGAAEFAP